MAAFSRCTTTSASNHIVFNSRAGPHEPHFSCQERSGEFPHHYIQPPPCAVGHIGGSRSEASTTTSASRTAASGFTLTCPTRVKSSSAGTWVGGNARNVALGRRACTIGRSSRCVPPLRRGALRRLLNWNCQHFVGFFWPRLRSLDRWICRTCLLNWRSRCTREVLERSAFGGGTGYDVSADDSDTNMIMLQSQHEKG